MVVNHLSRDEACMCSTLSVQLQSHSSLDPLHRHWSLSRHLLQIHPPWTISSRDLYGIPARLGSGVQGFKKQLTAICTPNSFKIRHCSLERVSPALHSWCEVFKLGTPRTRVVWSPSARSCGSIEWGNGSPDSSPNGVSKGPVV